MHTLAYVFGKQLSGRIATPLIMTVVCCRSAATFDGIMAMLKLNGFACDLPHLIFYSSAAVAAQHHGNVCINVSSRMLNMSGVDFYKKEGYTILDGAEVLAAVIAPVTAKKCTCSMMVIMAEGCKCGGV